MRSGAGAAGTAASRWRGSTRAAAAVAGPSRPRGPVHGVAAAIARDRWSTCQTCWPSSTRPAALTAGSGALTADIRAADRRRPTRDRATGSSPVTASVDGAEPLPVAAVATRRVVHSVPALERHHGVTVDHAAVAAAVRLAPTVERGPRAAAGPRRWPARGCMPVPRAPAGVSVAPQAVEVAACRATSRAPDPARWRAPRDSDRVRAAPAAPCGRSGAGADRGARTDPPCRDGCGRSRPAPRVASCSSARQASARPSWRGHWSDVLFGGRPRWCASTWASTQEPHAVARLVGAPPGYVG